MGRGPDDEVLVMFWNHLDQFRILLTAGFSHFRHMSVELHSISSGLDLWTSGSHIWLLTDRLGFGAHPGRVWLGVFLERKRSLVVNISIGRPLAESRMSPLAEYLRTVSLESVFTCFVALRSISTTTGQDISPPIKQCHTLC